MSGFRTLRGRFFLPFIGVLGVLLAGVISRPVCGEEPVEKPAPPVDKKAGEFKGRALVEKKLNAAMERLEEAVQVDAPVVVNENEEVNNGDLANAPRREFLRTLARGEIYLIHKCCQLSKSELDELSKAGEKEVQRLIKLRQNGGAAADQLRNAGIIRIMPNGRRVAQTSMDSRTSIRLAIVNVANKLIAPEKLAIYQQEAEKREVSRKRASIACIVARIDRDLSLSAEQREKLTEVLMTSLKSTDYVAPEELTYVQQSVLPLPAKLIEPLLTDPQKEAWRKLPKQRNQIDLEELLINNRGGQLGITEEDLESLKQKATDPDASVPQEAKS
jgi:hypothetical protein